MDQLNLFPVSAPEPVRIDVEGVRTELLQLLDRLEAGPIDSTWDARTERYWVTVFPQMARWLPVDEAGTLCARFGVAIGKLATVRGS